MEFLIGLGVAVVLLIFMGVKTVHERTARIVERFGKFSRVLDSGLHFVVPFIDRVSKNVNLKIQQIDVPIETKTKDNVFVKIRVSVHLEVIKERVEDAYYKLDDPYGQISSYIFDEVRAEVPKMSLDEVFSRKEDIALAIQDNLLTHMKDYGYRIIKALVTDIEPDAMVKESMNRINAARRNKEALSEDAEGRKIAKIKDAEAEKESKRLQGEGVAEQRLAIIKGFADSVEDFGKTLSNVTPNEIMQFVLMTQHYDTIKEIGEKNSSILVPYTPGVVPDLQQQMMQGTFLSTSNRENIDKLKEEHEAKQHHEKMTLKEQMKEEFENREKSMLDIQQNIDTVFDDEKKTL